MQKDVIKDVDNNQGCKYDSGKAQLILVPTRILHDVARVREFSVQKYPDLNSWKRVEIDRWKNAFYRHWLAYLDDPTGLDEESGLPHLWHAECNLAFIAHAQARINNHAK